MTTKTDLNKNTNSLDSSSRDSISLRTIKGGMWMAALKVTHRGLGLVRTLVLARLLSPADFGIFGLALLAFNFVENFSVIGVSSALVQKKGDVSNYLNSAWTINLLRSFMLFLILYFGASLIANFFDKPEVASIIRAIAFIQLFIGVENIGTVFFQKDLFFNKVFYLKFASILCNLSVSITLALLMKNVWALVYGSLAGALVKALMSYRLHPFRPKLSFDFPKMKELVNFGKWFFGSSIIVFLITEGDDAVVGKLLGVTALGFYQMAYLLSNAPATEISNFVAKLTFPAYSKLQGETSKLKEAFFKVIQFVSFISFPISGLILIFSPNLTELILGNRWMPMVPVLQILTFWGVIRTIEATTMQIFYATGKPDFSTKILSVELFFIIALIYPFTVKWGLKGTAWTIVIASIIPNLFALLLAIKVIRAKTYDLVKILLLPTVSTIAMVMVVIELKMLWSGSIMLFINIGIGLLVYLLLAKILNVFSNYDIWFAFREAKKII